MVARFDPVAVIKRCPLIGPVPVAALGLLVLDVSFDGQKLRLDDVTVPAVFVAPIPK